MVTDYKKIKEQDISVAAAFMDLEAGLLAGRSCLLVGVEESKHVPKACKGSSEDNHHPNALASGDSLFLDINGGSKDYACVDTEQGKPMPAYSVDPKFVKSTSKNEISFLEREEGKPSTDIKEGTEVVAELPGLRRRRGSKLDIQKAQHSPDGGGGEVANGDRKSGSWSVHSKVVPLPTGLETRQQKSVEKPSSKGVKGKGTHSDEDLSVQQSAAKAAGKKGTEPSSVLDTFFQTIVQEPCMSFTSRPGDKPTAHYTTWPDVFDHHAAVVNKIPKSLKIEEMGTKMMRDGSWDEGSGAAADSHSMELERDPMISKMKAAGSLGRVGSLQGAAARDGNLQGLKTVPQAMAVFAQAAAAAKATAGKQIPFLDDLTDLPGWPLLSPSKVQLQKCDKCSREFCSPFNYRRHTRMHRRISPLDKEDLNMKRKHITEFWDKLLPEEAQHIISSKNCEVYEDLSATATGKSAVTTTLSSFLNQASVKSLPHAYLKAGQELLEIVDNRGGVFPLPSEHLLNILDEASEKTFLCGEPPLATQNYGYQADAGKNQYEEKNLIASLSFIVEQTLVKAWMTNKEAEALRNQQELVKEEEAALMKKRERHFQQKKKKKKSRQKGVKERKGNASQLAPHEMENESMEDEEGPSPEIIEEDDSPTASSISLASSGHEPNLPEPLELENYEQAGQVVVRDVALEGEVCTREPLVPMQKELINTQTSHEAVGQGNQQECSQDVRDLAAGSLHNCCADGLFCSKVTMEESRMQQLACVQVPLDENALGASEGSQAPVQAKSGQNSLECLKVEQEEQWSVQYRGQELEQKVERVIKDPRMQAAENLPSSIFRRTGQNLCGMESRYLEGSQHQNFSFKPSARKPSTTVSAYATKAGSGVSSSLGFGLPTSQQQQYRSKPVTNRSPHVVWTRKTPPQPAAVDSATESLEDESEKCDATASNLHEMVESFPESHALNVDSVVITSKAPKEERLISENREAEADAAVSSSTSGGVFGGVSKMSSMSLGMFNLDTNSEDWPCLPHRSSAQSTYGPKPTSISVLSMSSIQPEAGAVAMVINKGSVSCPKEYPEQEGFHKSLPSTVHVPKEAQAEGCLDDSRQVLVGSLTVPLEAFDGQSKDFSAGVSHYTYSMPRHLPFMSLNPKNLKSHAGSAATGEQRERGTVLKPGSLLSGTSRFLAAKVWRPVRSSGEHDEDADVNSSHVGLTHIASECEDGVMDMGASHSAWIAEALECHYSRWITAMQDPEAVHHTEPVQSCMEVQSASWNEFFERARARC
ncbi:hypothetical protein BDL97_09G109300 [Sphagnum fallax]|nr:hypothetical protein BDL97_09G109300 [Sphagnum fallax]